MTQNIYDNDAFFDGYAQLERESGPSAEQITTRPEWINERHRPFFLLVSARL